MSLSDRSEMYMMAKDAFEKGDFLSCETLLQQLILARESRPEIFYMLGTIYYDRSKFNKAIQAFERALEMDPKFTDASIGLSVVLNDIGRYEEGAKVFNEAQGHVDEKKQVGKPQLNERLAARHEELGQMYLTNSRPKEALEEFAKCLQLVPEATSIQLLVADCYEAMGSERKALKLLKSLLRDNGRYTPARVRMGRVLYNSGRIADAIEHWEAVLLEEPQNSDARRYLKVAQQSDLTL